MGMALADAVDDPHYEIIFDPLGNPAFDSTINDAIVSARSWIPNNPTSRWIGPVSITPTMCIPDTF